MIPLLAVLAVPAGGQPVPPDPVPADAVDPWATSFRPMPFHQIAEAVTARYAGRLLAAETKPPTPGERAMGAQLVYEFRLLTPQRNRLNIRVDAQNGRFLEVAGRGQLQARRGAEPQPPGTALPRQTP
ncbi:PepSY domain-containing protein [Paracoccus nototheniae]